MEPASTISTPVVQLLALAAGAAVVGSALWWQAANKALSLRQEGGGKEARRSVEPPFVGALDQGTSSTRFIVFDSRTRIVVSHQMELPPQYPRPGYRMTLPRAPPLTLADVTDIYGRHTQVGGALGRGHPPTE